MDSRLVALGLPLFALGAAAGLLRALSLREPPGSRRRRAYAAAWILTLLAGVPLWLVASAVLRLL